MVLREFKKWIEGISHREILEKIVSGLITVPRTLNIAEEACKIASKTLSNNLKKKL